MKVMVFISNAVKFIISHLKVDMLFFPIFFSYDKEIRRPKFNCKCSQALLFRQDSAFWQSKPRVISPLCLSNTFLIVPHAPEATQTSYPPIFPCNTQPALIPSYLFFGTHHLTHPKAYFIPAFLLDCLALRPFLV